MRIIQELVPGKQITLAHIIANPDRILYKKLGLDPAVDYSKAAIGIVTMSPAETVFAILISAESAPLSNTVSKATGTLPVSLLSLPGYVSPRPLVKILLPGVMVVLFASPFITHLF